MNLFPLPAFRVGRSGEREPVSLHTMCTPGPREQTPPALRKGPSRKTENKTFILVYVYNIYIYTYIYTYIYIHIYICIYIVLSNNNYKIPVNLWLHSQDCGGNER